MKKIILSLLVVATFFTACQNTEENTNDPNIDMSDFEVYTSEEEASKQPHGKACFSMSALNRQLDVNPGLYKKMYAIELATRKSLQAKKPTKPGGGGGETPTPYTGAITIPVVFNIIETSSGVVTQAQINSQIAILNEDYNNNNPNTNGIPSVFAGDVADVNITFTVAAINRKISSSTSWGTNDAMKHASNGGIDATDTSTYLNIWVCNIGGGILGYAQFPGGSAATDGVVIGTSYLGVNPAAAPYGDGRTATHEVGHWLNLRHIWGDGRCNRDDYVSDTPKSDRSNYGCPTYPTVHCRTTDMTMNYMDYTDDDCMYMFTNGQNDRMRTLFAAGGAKESFVN